MHFNFNADNYPFFQGNRLPTILLNGVFPLFSMASPFTRPCCEVSEVESGISTVISMAIGSCCGKQRIRGFLQNRVYHQQSFSPLYPLPEAAQRAGRSKPLSCRKLPGKHAIKKNMKMSTLRMQN